jgi:hypothetical protein
MKTLTFAALLLCVAHSSAQNDDTLQNPSAIPSTEFVAYHKTAGEQPIILGDALGQRVLLKDYVLPIYFGYPTRSYRILGAVITHGSSHGDESEAPRPVIMRSIAAAAKLHGAEAVIMLRLTAADRLVEDADGRPWIVAKAIAISWRRPNDS